MDAVLSPARQARAQHRHELRTLTYVTLDQANGGIVRNLSQNGIGVQVVAAVRPQEQLRVRFELRYPRLQVETRAEVVWATFSGQCGIRFLDLSTALRRQINAWIFGDLLEGISLHADHTPMFALTHGRENGNGHHANNQGVEEDDGLLVSATPVNVIELPVQRAVPERPETPECSIFHAESTSAELEWLLQPLSGQTLAWTVDILVVVAAVLLFALVFLGVAGEAPRWPLASITGAGLLMAVMYWGFFRLFAGTSLGRKLARIAESDGVESEAREETFR